MRRIDAALGKTDAELVLKNANIFNVFTGETEHGDLAVSEGFIVGIGTYHGVKEIDATGKTIVPGFIDGHFHLESSIVSPAQLSKVVVPHGTTAIVADPHEIANVCGTDGLDYILEFTRDLPLDIYFMISSCVPATQFDESGAVLDAKKVKQYMKNERVLGLAELMNTEGVFAEDPDVINKTRVALQMGKIIDGHAPGLSGKRLNAYTTAGAFSDHECTAADEAIEKLKRGQWIMVREGTAGKNLKALLPLCGEPYFHRCLFATDDKHPDDLISDGHIDFAVRKAIELGAKPENVYRMATINAATYFRLPYVGAVCPGYRADFLVLDDFEKVAISAVYKNGSLTALNNELTESGAKERRGVGTSSAERAILDSIHIKDVTAADFVLTRPEKVIGLVKNEILTTDEGIASDRDLQNDILKLAVVERHHKTGHMGLAYLKGYGLKSGAVATSVAHDSHNIICVGTNDEDMATAVMEIQKMHGGMVVVNKGKVLASLALPIAGLMCDLELEEVQEKLESLTKASRNLGVTEGINPFMTLSFASLPVIPVLRLTTLGVVDVTRFELVKP